MREYQRVQREHRILAVHAERCDLSKSFAAVNLHMTQLATLPVGKPDEGADVASPIGIIASSTQRESACSAIVCRGVESAPYQWKT